MSATPDHDAVETPDLPPDADEAAGSPSDTLSDNPQAEIEALRAEKHALYEKLARTQADYQNAQKRIERDMEQRLKVAAGHLVRAFLPVLDNLERAAEVPDTADAKSVLDGVRGTLRQWHEVLARNGLEPIAPEGGEAFDPGRHEALMQEDADYDTPTVTRLLAKGYVFDGRVLRPAQVAVSRSR